MDTVLSDEGLQQEIVYKKMNDGSYIVSMNCPMPEITAEMIEWWFWWHCQESIRYRIWFPKAHKSIKYHKKDSSYFKQSISNIRFSATFFGQSK